MASAEPGAVTLSFSRRERGCAVGDIRVKSLDDAPLIHELAKDFKREVGDGADVSLMIWAGPFELMVAVSGVLASAGAAAHGMASLLTALKRSKPHYEIQVEPGDGTTVKITGEQLPPELEAKVNQYFADLSDSGELLGRRLQLDDEVRRGDPTQGEGGASGEGERDGSAD